MRVNKWLIIILLVTQLAQGQDVSLHSNGNDPVELSDNFSLFIPQNVNQYLATQWSKGRLFYPNGSSKDYDSLNFDRYSNVLEVVSNNKAVSILPMGLSGALIYNSPSLGTVLIVGKVVEESKFLLLQSEGKYLLASYLFSNDNQVELNYKNDEIRFVPKKKVEAVIKEHYVIFEKEQWEEIKLNKSAFSKLFKVDKKELQSLASENGLNTNNKQGLKALFQLLNKK